jgi:UDP-N-acetylmuramoyl-tripeptide--D-alanyl-D-alanine ligase
MKLTKFDILTIPHLKAVGFDQAKIFKIGSISIDSRTLKSGDLFIAIPGDRFDGHNFISKAIESGASGIVVDNRWAESNPAMMVSIYVPKLVVENTIHALGHLANLYRRKFSIPVIAIGGSNGKTTTKEMVRSVLSTKYRVLSTEGNLNNHIGVPQTIFRLEKKNNIAVVEIGTNHPGEIEYLCSILEPTHGLITNIGNEHLEFFNSIEGVAEAEGELFHWLAKHRGIAFVNADEQALISLSKPVKKRVIYGFSSKSAIIKGSIQSFDSHAIATLRVKPKSKKAFELSIGAPGEHNAKNALAAATIGLTMKVATKDIQKALYSFHSTNKRMQVQRYGKITILNDTYNANPDSTTAALATLHQFKTAGKKIAILSDMLELGSEAEKMHGQIGKRISDYEINVLLTYGPLSKILHDDAKVPTKAHFDSKDLLSEYILSIIADGDIVLVKGSRGMKMEDVVLYLGERLSQKAGS